MRGNVSCYNCRIRTICRVRDRYESRPTLPWWAIGLVGEEIDLIRSILGATIADVCKYFEPFAEEEIDG